MLINVPEVVEVEGSSIHCSEVEVELSYTFVVVHHTLPHLLHQDSQDTRHTVHGEAGAWNLDPSTETEDHGRDSDIVE